MTETRLGPVPLSYCLCCHLRYCIIMKIIGLWEINWIVWLDAACGGRVDCGKEWFLEDKIDERDMLSSWLFITAISRGQGKEFPLDRDTEVICKDNGDSKQQLCYAMPVLRCIQSRPEGSVASLGHTKTHSLVTVSWNVACLPRMTCVRGIFLAWEPYSCNQAYCDPLSHRDNHCRSGCRGIQRTQTDPQNKSMRN